MYQLERKGYYVLPEHPGDFKGGITKAKMLGDAELRAIGGEDAQLLLFLTLEESATYNYVHVYPLAAGTGSSYSIRTTLMDKQKRSLYCKACKAVDHQLKPINAHDLLNHISQVSLALNLPKVHLPLPDHIVNNISRHEKHLPA